MRFHADLHLHSHFSRATSKNLNLEYLSRWAQIKGIRVVGTGDFVHPAWLEELEEKLEPAEEGLFRLKPEYERLMRDEVPSACRAPVRFLLTVEISNIYKRLGRVRKIHNVLFAPGFNAAKRIQARLDAIGNIRSDGRPILGLDSRDLLEITLESDPLSFLIPAHIWTPWFAVLGSQGGFDRIEECFADLTPHVFAIETGLSSDPLMNWRLSQLDPYCIVSNSDAHSPQKLGRETTLYDTELSYPALYRALSDPNDPGLVGTVEFFPEEGKYHYDGHRKCGTRLHPRETHASNGLCPVCRKPVTVGVMARVEALSDRPEGVKAPRWRPYHSLIPLTEIIGEAIRVGPDSKAVAEIYQKLLTRLGNEFHILMDAPIEEISTTGGPVVGEGIRRMREGAVTITPGYDGEFGTIKLFDGQERETITVQTNLFHTLSHAPPANEGRGSVSEAIVSPSTPDQSDTPTPTIERDRGIHAQPDALAQTQMAEPAIKHKVPLIPAPVVESVPQLTRMELPDEIREWPLNQAQRQAVAYTGGHLLIVAGPGTGKTHTLTHRIAYLANFIAKPEQILALTFTNKAAAEMKARLTRLLGDTTRQITVGTFHGACLSLLRAWSTKASIPMSFTLATPDDLSRLTRTLWPEDTNTQRRTRMETISKWKATGLTEEIPETVAVYTQFLRKQGLLDFDDVILETLKLIRASTGFRKEMQERFRYVFVDEYQDINPAQQALLLELVTNGVLITAIGDPNQAIYSFRGAEPRYFHTFPADFPDARTLFLAENYRSVPLILTASTQIINAVQTTSVPSLVATSHGEGRLTLHDAATDSAEAEYVVHQIEQLVGGISLFSRDSSRVVDEGEERSFGDIAVLYRLNSQRHALIEAFNGSGIPYQVTGETALIDRPSVSEITTLLCLSHGTPVAATAALRLLSVVVEGLGSRTVEVIEGLWGQQTTVAVSHLITLVEQSRALSVRARSGLQNLLMDVKYLGSCLADEGVAEALTHLRKASCWAALINRYSEAEDNLNKLIRCARLENDLTVFLDTLLLSRNHDTYGNEAERVLLMTLHAAKGLEFPVVFITGCEHELLPLQYPGFTADVEEERRLFYVGVTRAKERLYLLSARRRALFGNTYQTYPSPFLADIEEQLKQYDLQTRRPRKQNPLPESDQLPLF